MRPVEPGDASEIAELYAPFVSDAAVPFEETPPDADDVRERIAEVTERFPWVVCARDGGDGGGVDGAVCGYAYAHATAAGGRTGGRPTVRCTSRRTPAAGASRPGSTSRCSDSSGPRDSRTCTPGPRSPTPRAPASTTRWGSSRSGPTSAWGTNAASGATCGGGTGRSASTPADLRGTDEWDAATGAGEASLEG